MLLLVLLGCAHRAGPLPTATAPAASGPSDCLAAMNEIERRVDAAGVDRRDLEALRLAIDIAILDVCAQGMPDKYYRFCEAFYGEKQKVADAIQSGAVQAYCGSAESR